MLALGVTITVTLTVNLALTLALTLNPHWETHLQMDLNMAVLIRMAPLSEASGSRALKNFAARSWVRDGPCTINYGQG